MIDRHNHNITFLSDGDDTLRQLHLEMSPKATHLLDWFHLTMKLTVLGQYGKGLVQLSLSRFLSGMIRL